MSQPATPKKKQPQFRVTGPPMYAWSQPIPNCRSATVGPSTKLWLDDKARCSLKAALSVAIADKQRVAMFEQRVKEWKDLKRILEAWIKR